MGSYQASLHNGKQAAKEQLEISTTQVFSASLNGAEKCIEDTALEIRHETTNFPAVTQRGNTAINAIPPINSVIL
jgi:hypothetical protein